MESIRKIIKEVIGCFLEEGLTKTQHVQISTKKLNDLFKDNLIAKIENEDLGIINIIITKYDSNIIEQILVLINNLGYIISKFGVEGFQQIYNKESLLKYVNSAETQSPINLKLEPKRDLKNNIIPPILYHVTHTRHLDKIKKIGLVPKSQLKKSSHPDRIYLAKDELSAQKIAQEFSSIEYKNDHSYVVLEIDMAKLSGVQLHRDPNFENGYFVLDNIPISSINFETAKIININ